MYGLVRIVSSGWSPVSAFSQPLKFPTCDQKTTSANPEVREIARAPVSMLFTIPEDRQEYPVAEIYTRDELPVEKLGYVSYPLFCGKYLFGMIMRSGRKDLRNRRIPDFPAWQGHLYELDESV